MPTGIYATNADFTAEGDITEGDGRADFAGGRSARGVARGNGQGSGHGESHTSCLAMPTASRDVVIIGAALRGARSPSSSAAVCHAVSRVILIGSPQATGHGFAYGTTVPIICSTSAPADEPSA